MTQAKSSPLFAALLTPHRAMDRRAIRWVVAIFAIMLTVPAISFFAMGAWPVLGFLGLDIALLYWALSTSLKSGDAFEEVTLWPDALDIRQVSAQGQERLISFNPFFVRLEIARDHEGRISSLRLTSRENAIEIGGFLNADDKARFAGMFGPALHKARA